MDQPEQKRGTFLGLTQSSIITILTGVFLAGGGWIRLNSVETSNAEVKQEIKSLSDKMEAANKSQTDFQLSVNKSQMELQLSQKLIEARVLIIEQQSAKHR